MGGQDAFFDEHLSRVAARFTAASILAAFSSRSRSGRALGFSGRRHVFPLRPAASESRFVADVLMIDFKPVVTACRSARPKAQPPSADSASVYTTSTSDGGDPL